MRVLKRAVRLAMCMLAASFMLFGVAEIPASAAPAASDDGWVEINPQDITIQSCTTSAYAPPGFWGPTSWSPCSVFGYPGYAQRYVWYVPAGSAISICAQGKGYNINGAATWYGVGCGKSGGGFVPWGNRLGQPSFRARSYTIPLGGTVYWGI